MRDYGKVHATFWSSQTTRDLSDDGRLLALYLLTSPHSTIAGVFRLPDGYVCDDLQWSAERVREGFAELFRNGFANRCETTKWVFVVQHLKWNAPDNPNQRKAAAKVALSIPDACAWKAQFMRVCGESLGIDPADFENPSETVPEPFANQKQEQEQEQEQKQEKAGAPPPEPATPPEPAVVLIPVTGGSEYPITQRQLDEFKSLYPAVDVLQQLRAMRGWAITNPTKRKTRSGVLRFVNSWLAKEQDKGPRPGLPTNGRGAEPIRRREVI